MINLQLANFIDKNIISFLNGRPGFRPYFCKIDGKTIEQVSKNKKLGPQPLQGGEKMRTLIISILIICLF